MRPGGDRCGTRCPPKQRAEINSVATQLQQLGPTKKKKEPLATFAAIWGCEAEGEWRPPLAEDVWPKNRFR
ncbi:hypothetical protein AAVH_27299 [Aphelenchoides avenae]|nr:hypothetical protein AAVH_27299 [Aphelenchus avenae]